MTVNFCLLALDQIMNNAATITHMSGGQFAVPLVIRMTTGAGRQVAAQHSHSLEGWLAHIPGLKLLAPATLADARGMLAPALADPNPVLIFEHGSLYNMEGELPAERATVDIERAAIRRPGADVTLDRLRRHAADGDDAAEELAAAGIDAEVDRPARAAPARRRDRDRVGRADAPRGDRRRGLALRQPRRGGQRADHGAGVLRARRAGRARLLGGGADALPPPSGAGRAAAAGAPSSPRSDG